MFSRIIIDDSRTVIGNSGSVIDDSIVVLHLVASFTLLIYDSYIFILKATVL
jgi:hypothetical protein